MKLSEEERAILSGADGTAGDRMALQIVVDAARLLGAEALVPIQSAHIDGCLYHGPSSTLFAEKLVAEGAQLRVPATTNVGALNLLKPGQSRLQGEARKMAYRLMVAHERLGCRPSWTCAPYQAVSRPAQGAQVAWGESNAVAFCNSVLGARTNRYGDFLDIACAISGRAPFYGLHRPENRLAEVVINISDLPATWQKQDVFYPVLGALVGRIAEARVAAVIGLQDHPGEDLLKAFCAAAAATGAVGLLHLVGITPEAPDLTAVLGETPANSTITVTAGQLRQAEAGLSRETTGPIDAVALGSPHFSGAECRRLCAVANGIPFKVPVYVCIGRDVLEGLRQDGTDVALADLGVELVVDTCVVVTPILPDPPGVLMTNSAKFAHYAPGNTGYAPVFGSLEDCVLSAQSGQQQRGTRPWG